MHILLSDTAVAPSRSHRADAGIDLCADATALIHPGERALIPTGVRVILPAGHAGMICPRSGLAHKHGVTVLNAPGIIDEDFTGEIGVILVNHGSEPFAVNHGDRIAQLVITKVDISRMYFINEAEFTRRVNPENKRRDAGFGSTGR